MTPAQAVKLFEAVGKCDGSFRVLRDVRIGKARAVYVAAVAKIEAEYIDSMSAAAAANLAAAECRAAAAVGRELGAQQ
jgi:hypothetical protein